MTDTNNTAAYKWVVSQYDYGIDGREPGRIFGDDVGPFDTKEEAQRERDRLAEKARGTPYAPSFQVRQVARQVVRWA